MRVEPVDSKQDAVERIMTGRHGEMENGGADRK